jgi:hypothetical protein
LSLILTRETGDDVLKLFTYAREKGFAIPAVNVTSSSTVVATLEAARDAKAPIMYEKTPIPGRSPGRGREDTILTVHG